VRVFVSISKKFRLMIIKHKQTHIVSLIILIGFGLRVYQLGNDSFWNDEAGQALAAIQPSIKAMLGITRSHAMAMPLDYFVSRITSQLGFHETVMRFPSAVYGTLTIALYFYLVKQILRFDVALITALLVSLSAQHIYYSQEMRFYSVLTFFFALSNVCLLKLLNNSSVKNWLIFVSVTALGSYFHPYVLLVVINGFLYLCFTGFLSKRNIVKWRDLLTSSIVSGVAFLPGYLYFGAHQKFNYELLMWSDSLIKGIARGLTLLPFPYPRAAPDFGIWELLIIFLTAIGVITISKYSYHRYSLAIYLGVIIQIGVIIFANLIKGYWFASRQLIHMAPVIFILTALGAVSFVEYGSKMLARLLSVDRICVRKIPALMYLLLLCSLLLAATPRIIDCYAFPKGNGEQIATSLLETYQKDNPIWVIPGYEEKIYHLYVLVQNNTKGESVIRSLRPVNWDELLEYVPQYKNRTYIVVPSNLTDDQYKYLQEQNFRILVDSETKWGWNRLLLVRE